MKNLLNKIKESAHLKAYITYTKIWFKLSLLPVLYVGYFFNLNALTLSFYGSLVFFSSLNSHLISMYILFLFLMDIPITYGVLAVLMKNEKTRPLVYEILGEDNVKFFLGNPGQNAVRLASRAGLVFVGSLFSTVAVGGIQDQLNFMSADHYIENCKKANLPVNPAQLDKIYSRKLPININFKDIIGGGK